MFYTTLLIFQELQLTKKIKIKNSFFDLIFQSCYK
jgi:hypothetical protein